MDMNSSKLYSNPASYTNAIASSPILPSLYSRRRLTSRSTALQLSPSLSQKRVYDYGAFFSSPRSYPCSLKMSGRAQQIFSGPLRLLSNKYRRDDGSGRRASIPELVTELVVCEGFLDIASVCAAARVSPRWKNLAYRPSSFGCNLDFSPFGHKLTAQVFDGLIKARRVRLSRHNKRLQTVNLWNCCAISFRKSAELVGMCSGLKELRILHNKQRSCSHCVQEHHSTFFSDFSFLMNRCDNLWVRSSTEIFWLGRGAEFVTSTAADVQKWFADYLSVECSVDNACLARIAQLVNEFGRTVSEGRPMQSGLLFMLTSLRNHSFAQHGELEVLASDEQWIHDGQQIELAYMKFAVRGCTPPNTPPSAHPNAHPQLQQPHASSHTTAHSHHHMHATQLGSVIGSTAVLPTGGDEDIYQQNLAHAHALQAQSHLQALEVSTAMEDVVTSHGGQIAAEELTHLSQGQAPGTATHTGNNIAATLPSHVHFDALSNAPPALTQQVSPRVCTAPNHVLFIGAPYRWPQPRALPQAALKDAFSSVSVATQH